MKAKINDVILSYGQITKVVNIENGIYYLETPIVVPTIEYTRDWVYENEILEILEY